MQNHFKAASIAAVKNASHETRSVVTALQSLFDHLEPKLSSLVKRGDKVLVKVNMGCGTLRDPKDRYTTHPAIVTTLIRALQDCGAKVSFGDDIARAGKHYERIWKATGMRDVARNTGAELVDFVAIGAKEVRGNLFFPRHYLVSNAYLESDVVINAANCRTHANIVMSGAVKNMFGTVVGLRKALIHNLFRGDPKRFCRAIADIHATVKPDLSILDLTSVVEAHGAGESIVPVGVLLASADSVGLDALAAHLIGFDRMPVWTTFWADQLGVGSKLVSSDRMRGLAWDDLPRRSIRLPHFSTEPKPSLWETFSNLFNHTLLRPRATIKDSHCSRCGDCLQRCPVQCIQKGQDGSFYINSSDCADCGVCLKVCEEDAAVLKFPILPSMLRQTLGKSTEVPKSFGRPTI